MKNNEESVDVSVILINRNGGNCLRLAIRSLHVALEHAFSQKYRFEFLFVDNGSTDNSVDIASSEMNGSEIDWKVVVESTPGVNSARIAGLRESQGQYVIFTDNDLVFAQDWLVEYYAAFKAVPQCRVFAGRVAVGEVEGDIPDWLDLTGEFSRPSIVVRCENGSARITLKLDDPGVEGPVGPNMAFERSVFEEYGDFDTRFGLRPGSFVPGAEAEFFHRLSKTNEPFTYVPKAQVLHPLKKDQISKAILSQASTWHRQGPVTNSRQRGSVLPSDIRRKTISISITGWKLDDVVSFLSATVKY
jgi:glycosyltransferase involved in cell wall biosynthesis